MGLREFVSDPRFQSKDEETKKAMLRDYGVEEADFAPLLGFKVSPPDPRGMGASGGMAMRAGMQVLAPKNPRAILNAAVDAGRFANEIPGAMASVYKDYGVGALKGLGGMADSAIKAVGLPRSEYADAAFDPANTVQGVGKGVAQIGATVAATEAALAGMGLTGIGAFAAKLLTSPVGVGAGTAAVEMAQGKDAGSAVKTGVIAGTLAKLPGIFSAIAKKFPKASQAEIASGIAEAEQVVKRTSKFTPEEIAEAVAKAKRYDTDPAFRAAQNAKAMAENKAARLANRPVAPIPPSKLKPDVPEPTIPEVSKVSDRGRQAKAEFEARKASKEATKASETSQEASKEVKEGLDASMTEGRGQVARDWRKTYAELDAEGRRKLVKGLAGKLNYEDIRMLGAYTDDLAGGSSRISSISATAKGPVHAPPAFPGQQSAKGATKLRFASNLDKNVVKWRESGNDIETIQKKVKSIFKRDLSLDEIDSILIRAKETN